PPLPAGELTVHYLDVGQGDATVVIAPDATVLIDAGRQDGGDVVAYLRDLGVSRIDVVAITHPHADHIGQLDDVLAAVDVGEVWMSGTVSTSQTFEEAISAVEASDAAYEEPRAGAHTTVGSLAVDILHPAELTGEAHPDSLAMRVTYGSVSFLWTGDAETETETEMVARDADALAATVYQVGHHGSSTSTSPALLAAVGPEVAIYSAGAGNSYGHPHAEVLERLRGAGVAVYGTDTHGTVTVTTDGVSYSVAPARAGATPNPSTLAAPPEVTAGDPGAGAPCQPGQIDVNSASADDLERIAEVGPQRASQIVALRPFDGLADIVRVDGIGEATMRQITEEGLACAS
ncbi:MAG TPA: MBL fold metallo-hydrolase, partial [Acidimicrobiales bacterium]|nr:MBL fold metallo-hydrolase [Acidimicrobiales bacterium]